ncbi:hypothetical protein [Burkholderia ubonensis]|uniref:hypothetical protein n=1 Tax=Burkholderia ubonensis TaxID=101571 RepID=UPI000A89B55F|nr:hypothetical protein [Burkholderia ubonensis]
MGVKFKDFTRKQTGSSFWSGDTFESLEATVQTASAWIDEHGIQVINIETVVMPSSAFSGARLTRMPPRMRAASTARHGTSSFASGTETEDGPHANS